MVIDLEKFEARAREPGRTRVELENMRHNALNQGLMEYAAVADAVLRERYPAVPVRRGGGATPTLALYRETRKDFSSGKDAYVWLIERMRDSRPGLLESLTAERKRSSHRLFFAKRALDLFPDRPDLAQGHANVAPLQGGWFANVNLNHAQKFEQLKVLASACELRHLVDWSFEVLDSTPALTQAQAQATLGERLLDDLDSVK